MITATAPWWETPEECTYVSSGASGIWAFGRAYDINGDAQIIIWWQAPEGEWQNVRVPAFLASRVVDAAIEASSTSPGFA